MVIKLIGSLLVATTVAAAWLAVASLGRVAAAALAETAHLSYQCIAFEQLPWCF